MQTDTKTPQLIHLLANADIIFFTYFGVSFVLCVVTNTDIGRHIYEKLNV
jgi:hypothetical protein